MKKMVPLLAAVSVVGATAVCHAATIDFTNAATAALANGKSTYTYNDVAGTGVNVTVTAGGVTGAVISAQVGTGLSADGLGVASKDDGFLSGTKDEINDAETLTVGFSQAVTVQSITLTDLYKGTLFNLVPADTGEWSLLDSSGNVVATGDFKGVENRLTNGVLSIDISQVANDIVLQSTNGTRYNGFSVASVEFQPAGNTSAAGVPELSTKGATGAALLLTGIGILFAGERRRRTPRPS
jgi:hypothetical protein